MSGATGSGGFVYRAEKESQAQRTATGEVVGPGSYNLATTTTYNPAPAPFHTSNERAQPENVNAFTPGVGSYDTGYAQDALQLRHVDPVGPTVNFSSNVARLPSDNKKDYIPGPGTYPEANAWVKRTHHYAPPSSKQRIAFQKGPTAPSIPAQNQSFGYEEGITGELVLQRPSDPIHTGEGMDKVGPGSYNVAVNSFGAGTKAGKAVIWSNSRTKRDADKKNVVPGPGHYNPVSNPKPGTNAIVVSINGVDVQFGGASGSSQFASKVPLTAHRQPTDHEMTPGPGSYAVDQGISARTAGKRPPKDMQFFGATSRRHSEIDPTKSLSAPSFYRVPGPGAYEDTRKAVNVRKSLSEPQPFLSTASRFKASDSAVPGPGEYRPDYVQTLAKDIEDKAVISRGGVFGSTATRWVSKTESQPGPGNYDPHSDSNKINSSSETSNFTSKTRRFAPPKAPAAIDTSDQSLAAHGIVKGDPARLGPGCYMEKDTWSKRQRHPGYKNAAFGSDAQRNGLARAQSSTPGPGRYNDAVDVNKVYRPFSVPARETVFGVQADRFKGGASFTPGPGHYSTSGDVVKKSFNITFAKQEA